MTLKIDGSMGEGGGQVLRAALTLSMATGRGFRMEKIRAGRKKPGLAAQHLTCVRAAARVSGARVSGDRAGSGELSFSPGRVRPGEYSFRIRTAGSTALVVQTVALPLALAGGPSRLSVTGGTHVPWSPTAGYLSGVWARAMGAMGLRISVGLAGAGYYPKGGGRLEVVVDRARGPLVPLEALERGSLHGLGGRLTISRLPGDVAERCRVRADGLLQAGGHYADWRIERLPAPGPGVCLELTAGFGLLSAGFSAIGERGKPAERLAEEAAGALIEFLASGAALEEHLADQLVVPLALAGGESRFSTGRVTPHLLTVAEVARAFLPGLKIDIEGEPGEPGTVRVRPGKK